jgi:hypothetical protein
VLLLNIPDDEIFTESDPDADLYPSFDAVAVTLKIPVLAKSLSRLRIYLQHTIYFFRKCK